MPYSPKQRYWKIVQFAHIYLHQEFDAHFLESKSRKQRIEMHDQHDYILDCVMADV